MPSAEDESLRFLLTMVHRLGERLQLLLSPSAQQMQSQSSPSTPGTPTGPAVSSPVSPSPALPLLAAADFLHLTSHASGSHSNASSGAMSHLLAAQGKRFADELLEDPIFKHQVAVLLELAVHRCNLLVKLLSQLTRTLLLGRTMATADLLLSPESHSSRALFTGLGYHASTAAVASSNTHEHHQQQAHSSSGLNSNHATGGVHTNNSVGGSSPTISPHSEQTTSSRWLQTQCLLFLWKVVLVCLQQSKRPRVQQLRAVSKPGLLTTKPSEKTPEIEKEDPMLNEPLFVTEAILDDNAKPTRDPSGTLPKSTKSLYMTQADDSQRVPPLVPDLPTEKTLEDSVAATLYGLLVHCVRLYGFAPISATGSNGQSDSGHSSMTMFQQGQTDMGHSLHPLLFGCFMNNLRGSPGPESPPPLDSDSLASLSPHMYPRQPHSPTTDTQYSSMYCENTVNASSMYMEQAPTNGGFGSSAPRPESITVETLLQVKPQTMLKELQSVTGTIAYSLSLSNWDLVFKKFKDKIVILAHSEASAEEEYLPDIQMLEWYAMPEQHLRMMIQEVASLIRTMKKSTVALIAPLLRQAIWNWISFYPKEFEKLHRSGKRLDGCVDRLFDYCHSLSESSKRKHAIQSLLAALMLIWPECWVDIQAWLASGNGTTSSISDITARKPVHIVYFESLIQGMRSSKTPELTISCLTDICKAGLLLSKVENSGLYRAFPQIEKILKDKVFTSFRGTPSPEMINIISNLFQTCYRHDPQTFLPHVVTLFFQESVPPVYRLVFMKSLLTWINHGRYFYAEGTEAVQHDETFYSHLARPLRTLFVETISASRDKTAIEVKKSSKNKKKDDDVDPLEIVFAYLQLCQADPLLPLWVDVNVPYDFQEIKELFLAIVHALSMDGIETRSVAANALLAFLSPTLINYWSTPSRDSNAPSLFWSGFSQLQTAITKLINDSIFKDESQTKLLLETLQSVLICKNTYLDAFKGQLTTSVNFDERKMGNASVESMLLVSLCTNNSSIQSISTICMRELARECAIMEENGDISTGAGGLGITSHNSFAQNYPVYLTFLSQMNTQTAINIGKVAFQKRVRKMLRLIDNPTFGVVDAWKDVYRRWHSGYINIVKGHTENSVEPEKKRISFVPTKLTAAGLHRSSSVSTVPEFTNEEKLEWQNMTGFLCALGGCYVCLPGNSELIKPGTISRKNAPSSHMISSSFTNLVSNFISELLEVLVCDNVLAREAAREILGTDFNPRLYYLLFSKFDATINSLTGSDGEITSNEKTSFHIEQAISVLRLILERNHEHLDQVYAADLGSLVLRYVRYLGKLSRSIVALRMKIKCCQLVEQLVQKRDNPVIRDEIRVQNRLLEYIVEWTSEFSVGSTTERTPMLDDTQKNLKVVRDLDLAVMKALIALLMQLPLQPTDSSSSEAENLAEARGRLFLKYFQFFIAILKKCRVDDLETKDPANPSVSDSKDFNTLKENTILALSNLLSANIDCGLKHAFAVGYHEDSRTRAAFMQVLVNILRQGAEFEGLSESYSLDRFQKLVDYLYQPDLTITITLCDVCAVQDIDDLASLLLSIFETRNISIDLIRSLVLREVSKADSITNIFRRNSMASKLTTLYAKKHATEYLSVILTNVMTQLSPKLPLSFEIDPARLTSNQNIHENLKNVEWLALSVLNAIVDSSHIVPSALRNVCYLLRVSVDQFFPHADPIVIIGGFIFLRFFSPAIMVCGIPSEDPEEIAEVRRGLTLVTKIIQNLSNDLKFGAKESFMTILNPFLDQNITRVRSFLSGLVQSPAPLETSPQRAMVAVDDVKRLHQYLVLYMESIGKELSSKRRATLIPLVPESPASLHPPLQSFAVARQSTFALPSPLNPHPRSALDMLQNLLAQLGPPAETRRTEHSTAIFVGSNTNQEYHAFMELHKDRNIDPIKQRRIFYEGGASKEKHPVFYFIARRFSPNVVDVDLLIYHIFLTLRSVSRNEYDIVVDLTYFGEENVIESQWLQQFGQRLPAELSEALHHIYIYNVNSVFKKYAKKLQRFIHGSFQKKLIVVNSANEFIDYISPIELRLPKTTVIIDEDSQMFSNVTRNSSFRVNTSVFLKINAEALQIITARKADILGCSTAVNDVYPTASIDDVLISADKSDDFVIRLDGGRSVIYLSSPKRDQIIDAVKRACGLSNKNQRSQNQRTIRPNDVPGTLLNMALLNMGSEDPVLRLTSYNLLCVLSETFDFQIGNMLISTKGILIPANNTGYITQISEKLANLQPRFTIEFLKECFLGFYKSSTELKHLCLEYMGPWLQNLNRLEETQEHVDNAMNTNEQIADIIRMLIDLTFKEQEMYPSIQAKIWRIIGSMDDILDTVIDCFVNFCVNHGVGSREADTVMETCVTLSLSNPHVVPGKIISRLRWALSCTANQPMPAINLHERWEEITSLLRFCLCLSFNDRLNVQKYLPELLYLISMLVSTGSQYTRSIVHSLVINIVHSLSTSVAMEEEQRMGLNLILNEFTEPKFRLLFGITGSASGPSPPSLSTTEADIDLIPLNNLETIVLSLYNVIFAASISLDVANAWRARWVSLSVASAFEFNPSLQPRAFIILGCLAKSELDDELLFQILGSLEKSLFFFEPDDPHLTVSILSCIANMVEGSSVPSQFLECLFWIGMSLLQMDHPAVFSHASLLVQTVLQNLHERQELVTINPALYLMAAREPWLDTLSRLDRLTGLSFDTNFSFSIAAITIKGLRRAETKPAAVSLLLTFLDIWIKFFYSLHNDGMSLASGSIHPEILGILTALLPFLDKNQLNEILWMIGVKESRTRQNTASSTSKVVKSLQSLDQSNANLVVLLTITLLENTENEMDIAFLFDFLSEFSIEYPKAIDIILERLSSRLVGILSSSHSSIILNATQKLVLIITTHRSSKVPGALIQESSDGKAITSLINSLGFASFALPCESSSKESHRSQLMQTTTLICQLLEHLLR